MINEEVLLCGIKHFDGDEYERMRKKAHALCKEYLHGAWNTIEEKDFVIQKVGGGLSNLLYYCALPQGVKPHKKEPSRALLRIYGNAQENVMEGHLTECVVFTMLSESQSGPRLYGIFPGGRLEQYIPGRHLTTDELLDNDLSRLIAEAFAEIHSMSFPLPKEPTWLWTTLYRWLANIESFFSKENFDGLNVKLVQTLQEIDLRLEVDWMRNFLSRVQSPVVFCHNDLQEGNILLKYSPTGKKSVRLTFNRVHALQSKGPGKIVLIDFEYSAYNHRGFDLANHLNETMYDYSNEEFPYFWAKPNNFPTKEQQIRFAERYLCKFHNVDSVSRSEVDHLLYEIEAFTLASHMFWAVWSIVMACKSTIEFDHWGFCEARLSAYCKQKAKVIDDQIKYNLPVENCSLANTSPPISLIEIS